MSEQCEFFTASEMERIDQQYERSKRLLDEFHESVRQWKSQHADSEDSLSEDFLTEEAEAWLASAAGRNRTRFAAHRPPNERYSLAKKLPRVIGVLDQTGWMNGVLTVLAVVGSGLLFVNGRFADGLCWFGAAWVLAGLCTLSYSLAHVYRLLHEGKAPDLNEMK